MGITGVFEFHVKPLDLSNAPSLVSIGGLPLYTLMTVLYIPARLTIIYNTCVWSSIGSVKLVLN